MHDTSTRSDDPHTAISHCQHARKFTPYGHDPRPFIVNRFRTVFGQQCYVSSNKACGVYQLCMKALIQRWVCLAGPYPLLSLAIHLLLHILHLSQGNGLSCCCCCPPRLSEPGSGWHSLVPPWSKSLIGKSHVPGLARVCVCVCVCVWWGCHI